MSLTVEIIRNDQTQQQTIEHGVCRIGSGTNMELCIAGLIDHAVTLRVQGTQAFIYNRSAEAVTIQGKLIPPEATYAWQSGQTLDLGRGTKLRLLPPQSILSMAASSSESLPREVSASASEQASVAERIRSKYLLPIGVLLIFAWYLFAGANASDSLLQSECAEVLEQLHQAEQIGPVGRHQQLRIGLQNIILRSSASDSEKQQAVNDLRQTLASGTAEQRNQAIERRLQEVVDKYF